MTEVRGALGAQGDSRPRVREGFRSMGEWHSVMNGVLIFGAHDRLKEVAGTGSQPPIVLDRSHAKQRH